MKNTYKEGDEVMLKKSGNIAILVERHTMGGLCDAWVVKRKDTGKEMIVPETGLISRG